MKTSLILPVLLLTMAAARAASLELVSVERIWNQAPYCAMGDLIRFQDRWFCCFTERQRHMPKPGIEDDGKVRVIASKDGKSWSSAALIAEPGTDLRDPHLSITPDGRLMLAAGGSKYPGGVYRGRQARVFFSGDGSLWSKPQPVLEEGHWLWRVTWHEGKAYGISKYGAIDKDLKDDPKRLDLVMSDDGVHWKKITELKVPRGDEAMVRFLPDGRMVALVRRELPEDDHAMIGVSPPPFTDWSWQATAHHIGGPDFIVLPDGKMIAGGRLHENGDYTRPQVAVGFMTLTSFEPALFLPSDSVRGNQGYPGFVLHDGLLWTAYYSAHEREGRPEIFLAKIRIKP